MKHLRSSIKGSRREAGITLVEIMVATAISTMVIAVVAVLVIFALRSFVALANYQILDQASAMAADKMSREIREATSVKSFQPNGTTKRIVFENTNASPAYTITYEWTDAARTLTAVRSDQPNNTDVLLEGCDRWDFIFQQRTPQRGPNFGFTTNMANNAEAKVVTMTWKCTRALAGTGLFNTESVQTAQIVIRNQKTP